LRRLDIAIGRRGARLGDVTKNRTTGGQRRFCWANSSAMAFRRAADAKDTLNSSAKFERALVWIPDDGDQDSETMSIKITK
jgi:hypothetical protein